MLYLFVLLIPWKQIHALINCNFINCVNTSIFKIFSPMAFTYL